MKKIVFIFLGVILLFTLFAYFRNSAQLIPWVWEYSTDLTYLPRGSTVAYFAGIITVADDGRVVLAPRRQPMRLNDHTRTIPVVRIDRIDSPDKLNASVTERMMGVIAEKCLEDKKAVGCQIDFDALESEYGWYLDLITKVHMNLGTKLPLSITALVSWCYPGGWLDKLPTDVEVVPMFFRMGSDAENIRAGRVPNNFLGAQSCSQAVGISTDEPLPLKRFLKGKKEVYIFSPDSLKESDYNQLKIMLSQWHEALIQN